ALTGTATSNTSSSRSAPRSPGFRDEPFLLLVARGGFALHAAASPAARLVRPAGARCAAGLSVLRRGCRLIVRDMT
ncbi:hypothetical protein, partial [Burkholderia pseudomallei]|uniref:hypothetical protein n=1 Tax=Burkholderia pseudomallei TaxID=28450 RepID=UPI002DB863D5